MDPTAAGRKRQASVALFSAIFTAMIGIGIIAPILPLYAEALGASVFCIGVVFSVFSFSRLLFTPIFGRLSDRIGRKAFIAVGLFLYLGISLGFIVASGPIALIAVRFCQGVAASMIFPIAMAYTGDLSPHMEEGRTMGRFLVAVFAGYGFGPLIGGLLHQHFGFTANFLALGAVSLVALLVVLFFLPDLRLHQGPSPAGATPLRTLLRSRNVVAVLVYRTVTSMCTGLVLGYLPILATRNLSLTTGQIGIIMTGNILITATLQAPFGRLADRVSRAALVVAGGIIFSIAVFCIPLAVGFVSFSAVTFLTGLATAISLPAATAIMVEEGRGHGMGSAMGLLTASMSLGLAIGPLVGGAIAHVTGVSEVFRLFLFVGLFGVAAFALLFRPGAKVDSGS